MSVEPIKGVLSVYTNPLYGTLASELLRGYSAYNIAVMEGYEGTVDEWLASLVGPKGDKGDKGDPGLDGEQGPRGYTGETGATGPKGDKGDKGETGNGIYAVVLRADYTLAIYFTDGSVYNTPSIRGREGAVGPTGPVGPQGEVGPKGDTGNTGTGISSIVQNADHSLTINLDDGTSYTTDPVEAMKGDKGDTGNGISSIVMKSDYTLQINMTNGTSYSTPSIRGVAGAKGDTGATGPKGDKGDKGDPGALNFHICSQTEYDATTRVPTVQNPEEDTFYLVPSASVTSPDLFVEWIYVNNAWEMFGSATVDISGKADKVQNATSGNFAGLDSNGNLTDSGHNFTEINQELTDLKETLYDSIGLHEIQLTKGGYIVTEGTTVDPSSVVSGANYAYAVVDCLPGDAFTVWGTTRSDSRTACFIDANNVRLNRPELKYENPTIIVAPENASKLILNATVLYSYGAYKGKFIDMAIDELNTSLSARIDEVESDYMVADSDIIKKVTLVEDSCIGAESIVLKNGYYIKTNNETVDVTSPIQQNNMAYAVVPCTEGDKFTVWGTGASYAYLYCFVDDSGNKYASRQAVTEHTLITTPANVTKLVVNAITLYDTGAYKGILSLSQKTATTEDIGKALSPKTVTDGIVTEWQYVDVEQEEPTVDIDTTKIGLEKITDLISGKYIKTNDATVDVTTEQVNAGMAYKVLDCQAGDVFVLQGTGVSFAAVYAFIDSNGKKITYKQSLANSTVIAAPYGATKLVLNVSTAYDYEFYKGISISDRIDTLEDILGGATEVEEIKMSYGWYIKTNETTINPIAPMSDNGFSYAVLPCTEGDVFTIWGTGASYAYVYLFIDDSGNKYTTRQAITDPTIIVAPHGATKLVLNKINQHPNGFYKGDYLSHKNTFIAGSQWKGKTIATYGDSITWYNGREFAESHSEAGQIAIGYQHYLEDLGVSIVNKGASGYRMDQILGIVKASTITNYDCVTITCGANDFRYPTVEPLGTIAPIGSTFDEGTMIGALQSAIEWLIATKPLLKIVLIAPIKGFSGATVMPEEYAQAFIDVGNLYSLPVCDWYHNVGINVLNKSTFIGDDESTLHYALHPTNAGFKRMGEMLRGFLSVL